MRRPDLLRCSFCHKTQDEVVKLISSPSDYYPRTYICGECVAVCQGILGGEALHPPPNPEPNLALLDLSMRILRRRADGRQPGTGDIATLLQCALPEEENRHRSACYHIILREPPPAPAPLTCRDNRTIPHQTAPSLSV